MCFWLGHGSPRRYLWRHFFPRNERMASRPRIALRTSDTPADMIMRRIKADKNLNHAPWNASQNSLTERNNPVAMTSKPNVPIKNRKAGRIEISRVLNMLLVSPPNGLRYLRVICHGSSYHPHSCHCTPKRERGGYDYTEEKYECGMTSITRSKKLLHQMLDKYSTYLGMQWIWHIFLKKIRPPR